MGCGVSASSGADAAQVIRIEGDRAHPANNGRLCVKGSNLNHLPADSERLLHPEVGGKQASWVEATHRIAREISAVLDSDGPEAIAFYLSGQLLTEDYYVANKLMKGFLGSANVDTNSRLCMASAVAAHKRAFGEDVVPCNYEDVDHCDVLVMVGWNGAWTHPVLYQRIERARRERGLRVILIDPRRTASADIADLHLPLKPGSDGALFRGLLHYLATHDLVDDAFVEQCVEGTAEALENCVIPIADVAAATGLDAVAIEDFYAEFGRSPKVLSIFSQGINQSASGSDNANAIINCHLLTGKIGQPGAGPFSMTGQPNAMGGREVGGLANQLAAHMDFSAESIDRVSRFWGSPSVATQPGLKAVDMFEAVAQGRIKLLWIMGTNPAVSLPDTGRVRQALRDCPMVIVSDCVASNDTLQYANIRLPALGWGEKDGTVTNSERVISRQRPFLAAPGQARQDWQAIVEVARALGFGSAFNYRSSRDIFSEHARLSGFENQGQRQFDIGWLAHLSAGGYDALEPVQWPRQVRPFADRKFSTATGKARMISDAPRDAIQQVDERHPLVLNTGRVRDQWHTMTRTGYIVPLQKHQPAPQLLINPVDAATRDIASDDLLKVYNHRGSVHMLATVTTDVTPGQLFAPIHWSDQFAGSSVVSSLFAPAVDPVSGQPESKHGAVACEKLRPRSWIGLCSERALDPGLLNAEDALVYWYGFPHAQGWYYELALVDEQRWLPPGCERIAESVHPAMTRVLCQLPGVGQLMLQQAAARGELAPPGQMAEQLARDTRPWLKLAAGDDQDHDRSRMVCSCFDVSEAQIIAATGKGARSVEQLGQTLRCGTNCGSCVPELRQLIDNAGALQASDGILKKVSGI